MNDPVNHPPHYESVVPGIEAIQVTQHFSFCRGNAIKYIWRAKAKGNAKEDLEKALWYINQEKRSRGLLVPAVEVPGRVPEDVVKHFPGPRGLALSAIWLGFLGEARTYLQQAIEEVA